MTERNDAIRKLRGAARIAKTGTYAARVKFRGRLYHFLTWETKGMACLAYNWACCKLGVPHRMNSFTALAAAIPDLAAEMSYVYGTLDSRFAGAAPRGNGGDLHPRVRMSSAATEVNPDDDSGYVGDPTPLMSLSPNGIEQSRAPASRNRSEDAETMPQHRAQLPTSTDGILEDCASSQQGQGIGELHSQVAMRTFVDDSTHTHQDTAGPVQGLANEAPLRWTDTAVEGAPGRADNEDWSDAYLQLMEQDCEPVAGEGDPASRAWEPKPGLQLQLQETGLLEEGEWRAGSIGDVMAGAGEDGRCELAFGEGIAFPYTTGSDTPQSVHAMRKSLVEKGGGGQEGLYVAAAGSGGPCCEQAVARGSALEQEHARQNAWIIPGPGIVIDDPNPPRPNPVAEAVGLGSSWQQECSAHPQPALSRRRSSLDEGPAPEAGARHIQAQQEGVDGVSTIGGVPLETAMHGYNASLDCGLCPRTCFYDLYMTQPAVSRAALHAVEMQPPSATLPFPDSCLPDPPAAGNTQDSLGALLEEAFMQTLEAEFGGHICL